MSVDSRLSTWETARNCDFRVTRAAGRGEQSQDMVYLLSVQLREADRPWDQARSRGLTEKLQSWHPQSRGVAAPSSSDLAPA